MDWKVAGLAFCLVVSWGLLWSSKRRNANGDDLATATRARDVMEEYAGNLDQILKTVAHRYGRRVAAGWKLSLTDFDLAAAPQGGLYTYRDNDEHKTVILLVTREFGPEEEVA